MAKYRIKVEALDPAEELRAEYRVGIECDRFYLVAITDEDKDGDESQQVALENVNKLDIAQSIFENDVLMEAAIIADGLRRAREYRQGQRMVHGVVKISPDDLKKLFGGGKA